MSERALDPRLQKLYDENIPVYSISRLDCINRCLYEAYLTYICKMKGRSSVWGMLGGKIHDVLEGITNGVNTENDLLPAMQDELDYLDLMDMDFPKSSNGESTIRNNWVANMTHFCQTYKAPKGKLKAEELFIYKTPGGHYLQGYIDLQRINANGSIDIYDYKTSSLYKGKEIAEHARQLILYALGKEQEGYTVNSASWIFLKYAEVRFLGKKTAKSKKDTQIIKVIERRNLAKELAPYIEGNLLDSGMEEIDVEILIDKMKTENSLKCLPEEIQNLYEIVPYVLKADLSSEARTECINYIDGTIEKWEKLSDKEIDYPHRSFTKLQKNGKEVNDYFFCTSLCGHFHNCRFIQEFLELLERENEEENDDLF